MFLWFVVNVTSNFFLICIGQKKKLWTIEDVEYTKILPLRWSLIVYIYIYIYIYIKFMKGGARGIMVFDVRNGHGDTSSKPGQDCLHFT